MRLDDAFVLVRHACETSRLAHAYVIAGAPRGEGGELAFRILQMLFCESSPNACGACVRCQQVRARTWADAFWVQPEKKSRAIGAEQMRERLLAEISQTSLAGGWKAGIVVAADRMTDAAANVFLKTLEEPPPQSLLLLLTDAPQLLLPTIVSRCQRIEVAVTQPLPDPWRQQVLDVLIRHVASGPLPAMGGAGRLAAVLKEMKDAAAEEIKREGAGAAEDDGIEEEKEVIEARISARYREWRTDLLRELLNWYRDLLVLRAGGEEANVHHADHLPVLRERAARLTLAQAIANVQGVEEMNAQLERSLPEEHVLAYWLDRLSSGGKHA